MRAGKSRRSKYRKWLLMAIGGLLLFGSGVWRVRDGQQEASVPSEPRVWDAAPSSAQWKRSLQPFPEVSAPERISSLPRAEARGPQLQTRVIPLSAIVRPSAVASMPSRVPQISRITVTAPQGEKEADRDLAWQGPVAPTGRLLQVELVNTIDSSLSHNPIIGLVTHDFYWEGHLLIPAGTEVHGVATVETARQNLMTGKYWDLVFMGAHGTLPNGWVLPLQAIALERQDATGEGKTFGWSDMRMGLPGLRMRAEDELDIKLFLSGFLGAAVASMQSRQVNPLTGGTLLEETAENAALAGVVQVLRQYGERILQEIERLGFYLRVRAGTQFYLLVQEPLDLNRGMLGGRVGGTPAPDVEVAGRQATLTPDLMNWQSLQQMESQIGEQWEALWNQYMNTVGK